MISMQIKGKIRNISNKRNIDFNTVFRLYMYDRFIERLALSKYSENFILKGGFYLSTLFGIENRSTMDIDTALTKISFSKENIIKIINEIILIDIKDDVKIYVSNITDINMLNGYIGYRVTLTIMLESIKEIFHIDIVMNDVIASEITRYEYYPILSETSIELWTCNLESVLSEKIETILSRAEANSRMRDFYDIFLIYKTSFNNINKRNLRKVVRITFENRKYNGDIINTIYQIKNSNILKDRWNIYAKKNSYTENISYEDVVNCLEDLIKVITKTK